MTGEFKNTILQRVFERDKEEFALADTLDIKTSIILVALTFLATQTSDLLRAPDVKPFPGVLLLTFSLVSLAVGGVAAIAELIPRNYYREATPDKYEKWLDDLRVYNSKEADPETAALDQAINGRVEMAKSRIQKNLSINKNKSWLMTISFAGTAAAFVFNLTTLVMRLF